MLFLCSTREKKHDSNKEVLCHSTGNYFSEGGREVLQNVVCKKKESSNKATASRYRELSDPF
jgi:hypothetical protein